MKNIKIAFIVMLLQCAWTVVSNAAEPAASQFEEERLKQDKILRSTADKDLENYTVNRSLADYADALSPGFDDALAKLGPKDRWMDIGAGKAQAILDYFSPEYGKAHPGEQVRRGNKAQAVAISVEDRRTPLWHQTAAALQSGQIRYFFDKRMRDYSLAELGRFQVITDLIGGFSYTEELSRFMQKVLELLELNGTYFTVLQDVHSEAGTNRPYYPDSPFLTELTNSRGEELKVCAWLKSIGCVEVDCELKMAWKPPIEVYRIHKVCEGITVPALVRTHFEAGTPPERRFRLAD
jgi:hypothetical protein